MRNFAKGGGTLGSLVPRLGGEIVARDSRDNLHRMARGVKCQGGNVGQNIAEIVAIRVFVNGSSVNEFGAQCHS